MTHARIASSARSPVAGLLVLAAGCNNGSSSPTAPDQSAVAYSQTDLTVGTGAEATAGTTAAVQYVALQR